MLLAVAGHPQKGSPGGYFAFFWSIGFSGLDCWKQDFKFGKPLTLVLNLPIGISGNLSSPLFPGYYPTVPYIGLRNIGSY